MAQEQIIDKYKEALMNLICNIGVARSDYRKSGQAKKDIETLEDLINKYITLEKALLLACERISFNEGDSEEPETQEEAQDNYIYKKYTRPKILAEKYIKEATKGDKQ